MRVLAVVPNLLGWAPGQRSTIEAWEPTLRSHGFTVDYDIFETPSLHRALYREGGYTTKSIELTRSFLRRLREIGAKARDYDVVYLYREAALAGPEIIERLIARSGTPIVYELDDPLHVPYRSAYNGALSLLKFRGKVARICELSAAVIANSSMIRSFAEQHNRNVWQIPSVVDERQYTFEPHPPGRAVVGWSGSPTTAANLAMLAGPLRRFQESRPEPIRLVGATTFDLPGVAHSAQPWSAETEILDLRSIDIGLVPLPDVPWNHHKFYMKVAQYMALGIVPIATPYGSIVEDIQHGVNGFHAGDDAQWLEALDRLARDDDLRARMSVKAAEDAASRYTVAANADAIVGAFLSAVA